MCAIVGFNWKDEEKVRRMAEDLSYRGPDASGVFVEEGISLGHDRLSVIDLSSSANQPMLTASSELAIIYNGEIYNFRELRRELGAQYEFRTKSDTEVLLAAYRQWGEKMVEHLNGMFAFAIWDSRKRSLFCARDRMGIKPFYYFWDGKRFVFASELKAILTHDIPRTLNRGAFNHYFHLLYTPAPQTLVENVSVLPPSHALMLKDGTVSIHAYGTDVPMRTSLSYGEAVRTLRDKVLTAVERHLVSDVPVGVYLSGGIDSSVVLSAMAKFHTDIKTFSIGFSLADGGEIEKFNQDVALAGRTAAHFGTDHHELIVSTDDALSAIEDVALHNSDPISNPTAIAMRLLARFARKQVSVALTGNAGDELFGGYDRYRMALLAGRYRQLPRVLRSLGALYPRTAKLHYESLGDLFARFMFQKDDRLSRIIASNHFIPALATMEYVERRILPARSENLADMLMSADRRSWLPDHFFTLSDKMSMASALEERVPFADAELVVFADSLPTSYKVDIFNTKKILKDAFRNDLPAYLFAQPKRGWFSPAAKWFREPAFAAFAREVLAESYYSETSALFEWKAVEKMLEDHIEKREYNLNILWAILTFQMWARIHRIVV